MTRESFPEEADRPRYECHSGISQIKGMDAGLDWWKYTRQKKQLFLEVRSREDQGRGQVSVETGQIVNGHASRVREFELLQEGSDDSSKGL